MRKLSTEKRAAILHALVEGCSINSTARLCHVSKITVLRLLADVGTFCRRRGRAVLQGLTGLTEFQSSHRNQPND
jgi:DNA-directed RNA polymerase specialized sigma24 family protein